MRNLLPPECFRDRRHCAPAGRQENFPFLLTLINDSKTLFILFTPMFCDIRTSYHHGLRRPKEKSMIVRFLEYDKKFFWALAIGKHFDQTSLSELRSIGLNDGKILKCMKVLFRKRILASLKPNKTLRPDEENSVSEARRFQKPGRSGTLRPDKVKTE